MKRAVLIGTVALTLAAAPAFSQAKKARASVKRPSDQTFVAEAAKGGMAEVELGKLAAEKATNPDVKKFGQRMADDHSKAIDELKMLAAKKNVTLPSGLNAKDKALRDRLSKLSGPAFDRAYMQAMVNDHIKDVSVFRREAKLGKDPDIKSFAAMTLPTLEEHLKMARTTDREVVGTSGAKRGSTKRQS